ncbi:unnamed protein product [Caenorhabditis sp. 36 PRJEB53466]|nr:unnamed protein product [Caenorhabditis sp. 36 PRJEB53466]
MRLFVPVFLLAASAFTLTLQEACDGSTPEMRSFRQIRPTNFITGSGNTTVTSRDECAKICAENENCAFAYFLSNNCYQANYFTTTLKRWVPGETLVKLFRDESSCNTTFPQLMSNSVKFSLKSRSGASYSYAIADSAVTFTYTADAAQFGKKKRR